MLNAVDLFCGGGGASIGLERATGYSPIAAVNHDAHAIAMHTLNHPNTHHEQMDVFDADPRQLAGDKQVDILWASPDCKHFSKAKGGKPKSKKIRALAWVVYRWCLEVKPTVMFLENVEEFQDWGPVNAAGQPIKARKGETFQKFVRAFRSAGYSVDWKVLNAADYGAPTNRKRLFMIFRRAGAPVWPEPTHGPGRAHPYRTAAECIDWSIECPSIFGRKRELAAKTQARIAEGIRRYVLEDPNPFIVTMRGSSRSHLHGNSIHEPLRTITASGTHHALVAPFFAPRYGERPTQAPRTHRVTEPSPTIVPSGNGTRLCAAWLVKHYGGVVGHTLYKPTGAITGRDSQGIVTTDLCPHPKDNAEHVAAFLTAYYGTDKTGQRLNAPMRTVTSKGRFGLVAVKLGGEDYVITDIGMRMLQPRELARAMGFPDDYQLLGTKTAQTARIGNAVCPDVVEALVKANTE